MARKRPIGPGPSARRTRPAEPAAPPPWPLLVLAAAWIALLVRAPIGSPWTWAFAGFRVLPGDARVALIVAAGAAAALAFARPRSPWPTAVTALALAGMVAFPMRERLHLLGDTDVRFRGIESFVAGEPGVTLLQWAQQFHASPLDLLVNLLLPVGLIRSGLATADALSLISAGLALAYFAGLHRLLQRLDAPPDLRFPLFLALALAGTLEVFAGYAEVGGLLLAALVWWWVALLAPLQGTGRAARAALAWLVLLLVHRIGWVLLLAQIWRGLGPALPGDRPESRRRLLLFSALAVVAGAAASATWSGLNQVGSDVRALLADAFDGRAFAPLRWTDFAGVLILVGPLAVLAPFVAGWRPIAATLRSPRAGLVLAAVLPLTPVLWLGLLAPNGLGAFRDWDLGVPLGAALAVGGAALLAALPVRRLRAALPVALAVLAFQAASWIAVNADLRASLTRSAALAPTLPAPQRATLLLFLGMRAMEAGERAAAARHFEESFDLAGEPDTGVLAAETWLMVRDVERARRIVERVRASGPLSPVAHEILGGIDTVMTRLERAGRTPPAR